MNELALGFSFEKQFLSEESVGLLVNEIDTTDSCMQQYGVRNAERKFPSIYQLTQSAKIQSKAEAILGKEAHLVRAILFDKTPEKNWLVAWHQDKTVAVNRKLDGLGWGPWTIKDSIHHVQPPETVLNEMITFRIHLDDTDADSGCLKVIPNSHSKGVLKQSAINNIVEGSSYVECTAKAGDLLIIKPLLLHASSKAKSPKHRRVIHLEFSSYTLPKGLFWV